nr:MAG TPA: hypothetical protein [Caudoviricetes sp.]
MGKNSLPVIKVHIHKRHFVDMITDVFDREYAEHRFELFREEIKAKLEGFLYDTYIIYGLQVVTFEIKFKVNPSKTALRKVTKWLSRNYRLADVDIWWANDD